MPSVPYINKHTSPFLKCFISAFVGPLTGMDGTGFLNSVH